MDDGGCGDLSVRLFLDPVRQSRGGESECRVLGELGLTDGNETGFDRAGVVDTADGDTSGVAECGNDDDPVGLPPRCRCVLVDDGLRFEREVASECGIRARDERDGDAGGGSRLEGRAGDLAVDSFGVVG